MEHGRTFCNICDSDSHPIRGPYVNCSLTNDPGKRDPVCSICYMPLDRSEELITHNECQRTWHKECVDNWIDHVASTNEGPRPVNCAICRRPIMQLVMEHEQDPNEQRFILLVVGNVEEMVAQILVMIRNDIRVRIMDKTELGHLLQQAQDLASLAFYEENIGTQSKPHLHQHNRTSSYDERDSGPFPGKKYVCGGALYATHCNHCLQVVMMTGPQLVQICDRLYQSGWCPMKGCIVPRVSMSMVQRPHSPCLADILQAAKQLRQPRVYVSPIDLAMWFPDSSGMQKGQKLYIRLDMDSNRTGWFDARICAYQVNTERRVELLDRSEALNLIEGLGGVCSKVLVKQYYPDVEDTLTLAKRYHECCKQLTQR